MVRARPDRRSRNERRCARRRAGGRDAPGGAGPLPARAPVHLGPIFAFGDPKLELTRIWGQVGGYLSASLLLFALLGLFSSGRRGLRLVLLVWIVLALARMYGMPVLGGVLGVLPRMSQVRLPLRLRLG